jgi:hypothetical protein
VGGVTMKKILFFILSLSLGVTLIACSPNKNDKKVESSKPEEVSDNSNDSSTKEETKKSETEGQQNSQKQDSTIVKDANKPNLVTLTTYTADENTLSQKTLSTIQVEENLSLKDKLTKISNELSVKGFSGLPIKVVRVETINGAKKATINLEDNNTSSWNKTYFQGTTGGAITAKSLIETFKQSSYSGEWISSVEFLYNNHKIQLDHVADLENEIKLR